MFPCLEADIKSAPTVKVDNYAFKVFSVGERGTCLKPELVDEVVDGLCTAAGQVGPFDSIVSIHVMGAVWALSVAKALGKPLYLFTTEPNGIPDQTSFEQQRPYLPRLIYTPDLSQVGRCVIIDDVMSGGGTIMQMKETIEKAMGKVVGAICVIDKNGKASEMTRKMGVPMIGLVDATKY